MLLKGAAARGELLRGVLELKPRKDPLLGKRIAGVVLSDVAAGEELADAVVLRALGDAVDRAAELAGGRDLFEGAKEKERASLLWGALMAGAELKLPKSPNLEGFSVNDAVAVVALLPNEYDELGFVSAY